MFTVFTYLLFFFTFFPHFVIRIAHVFHISNTVARKLNIYTIFAWWYDTLYSSLQLTFGSVPGVRALCLHRSSVLTGVSSSNLGVARGDNCGGQCRDFWGFFRVSPIYPTNILHFSIPPALFNYMISFFHYLNLSLHIIHRRIIMSVCAGWSRV